MIIKVPLIMLAFQAIILTVITLNSPEIIDFSYTSTIIFWVYCLFSYAFYFYTAQSCPGFVSQKDLSVAVTSKLSNIVDKIESYEIETPKQGMKNSPGFNVETKKNSEKYKGPIKSEHIYTHRSEDDEEEKDNTNNNIEVENMDDDIKIKEIRHCAVCRIDQPLRTKHCRDCGKCIATHDHHCPWLGVCVGEKNKKRFYLYLVIQLVQLVWATTIDLMSITNPGNVGMWFLHNTVRLLLAFVLGLFIFMVGALVGFHLYLASIGLTTWEYLSWNKISYLKSIDWKHGSPFSQGILRNLYNNCCRIKTGYIIMWEIQLSEKS